MVGGTTTGTVTEDGTLTTNGTLSISDVDTPDNPTFPDVTSTPGDNGYGSFQLTGGTWSYALDNANPAVQALNTGDTLSDSHGFVASDGTLQTVTVTIQGATEGVAPPPPPPPPEPEPEPEPDPTPEPAPDPVTEPEPDPTPEPAPDPVTEPEPDPTPEPAPDPVTEPEPDPVPVLETLTAPTPSPAPTPAPVTASAEPVPEAAEETTTEPALVAQAETTDGTRGTQDPELPATVIPGDAFLSVLATPDRPTAPSIALPDKPDTQAARTFLTQLKSIWQDDRQAVEFNSLQVSDSDKFWQDVDEMLTDFDEAAEDEAQRLQLQAEAAAGVGISLTAGFVSWALRAGSLAASFLAAMPAWRHFDPIPVLTEDDESRQMIAEADESDDSDEAGETLKQVDSDEDAVEELFDGGGRR